MIQVRPKAPPSETITVRVLKYDGSEYRQWNAQVARRDGSLIVLDAEFNIHVSHELLGEIKKGTRTAEYYWFNCWYNIFRFLEKDGNTRLWYCNLSTPPTLEDGVLSYIDLDVDVLVLPDFTFQVLDIDEFEQNAIVFGYPDEVRRAVQRAISEVTSLIETRQFPFTDSQTGN